MKIGIIGLPLSGKTTLWNLLTETYESHGVQHGGQKSRMKTVKLDDPRLLRIRDDFKPKKCTPAHIEVYDFPAVQKQGKDRSGLAELLAPARDMEALIVVLAMFAEEEKDSGSPAGDFQEIRGDLILSDLEIVEKRIAKLELQIKKHVAQTFEDDKKELDLLLRIRADLEAERGLLNFPFTPEEKRRAANYQFLSGKPQVVVLNRGERTPAAEELAAIRDAAETDPIPVAARNELEVLQLSPEDRGPFLEEFGIEELARERVVQAAYRAAGRISFFTAREKEARAWTVRQGVTAWEAAGEIHTDIQRGFIRAEVVSFEEYVRDGGIKGAKEKGHLRLEGKDYLVQDGDLIEFRFSV